MSSKRYTEAFKAEAVKQVRDRGFSVAEVAERLGVHKHSLYEWVRQAKAGPLEKSAVTESSDATELRRLRAESSG